MKKWIVAFVVLFLPSSFCMAQKDSCAVGIYINSLYDFELEDKSFMADFWIWLTYKNDSLKFDNVIEIPNSKSAEFSHYSHEKKTELNWVTLKCKAQMRQEWDVSRFPFDRQILHIEIEDSRNDASRLIYVADKINSLIDTSISSKEWCIENFTVKDDVRFYASTYGDPELSGKSSYPRIVASIQVRRNGSWLILTKMLTGAYVAFLVSCVVFFISSRHQDSRFALCVGGLFTAIGNKYIVESVVPASTINTLMDNVHNVTFSFILLIVCIVIRSLYLFQSGDERKRTLSLKLDRWSFYSVSVLYIVINVCLIYSAYPG